MIEREQMYQEIDGIFLKMSEKVNKKIIWSIGTIFDFITFFIIYFFVWALIIFTLNYLLKTEGGIAPATTLILTLVTIVLQIEHFPESSFLLYCFKDNRVVSNAVVLLQEQAWERGFKILDLDIKEQAESVYLKIKFSGLKQKKRRKKKEEQKMATKDGDEMLYRYMAFDKFVSIVKDEELILAKPFEHWDDLHEGILCAMYKKYGERFIEKYLKGSPQKDIADVMLLHGWHNLRAQSWCKSKDSAAMWAAYSNNKTAVMVGVKRHDLESLTYGGYKVKLIDVVYKDKVKIEEELEKVFPGPLHSDTERVLETKRECFYFENEVRIVKELYNRETRETGDILKIKKGIIGEVLIHPKAEDAFCKDVISFCSKCGIADVKRSTLLDLPSL